MINRWIIYEQLGLKDILTEDTVLDIVEKGKDHPHFERDTHECIHDIEKAVTYNGNIVDMCILCGITLS